MKNAASLPKTGVRRFFLPRDDLRVAFALRNVRFEMIPRQPGGGSGGVVPFGHKQRYVEEVDDGATPGALKYGIAPYSPMYV